MRNGENKATINDKDLTLFTCSEKFILCDSVRTNIVILHFTTRVKMNIISSVKVLYTKPSQTEFRHSAYKREELEKRKGEGTYQ